MHGTTIKHYLLVVGLLFGTGGIIETSCSSNWVDFWKVLYFWGMAIIGVSDSGVVGEEGGEIWDMHSTFCLGFSMVFVDGFDLMGVSAWISTTHFALLGVVWCTGEGNVNEEVDEGVLGLFVSNFSSIFDKGIDIGLLLALKAFCLGGGLFLGIVVRGISRILCFWTGDGWTDCITSLPQLINSLQASRKGKKSITNQIQLCIDEGN